MPRVTQIIANKASACHSLLTLVAIGLLWGWSNQVRAADEETWRPAPVMVRISNFGSFNYDLTYRDSGSYRVTNQRTRLEVGVRTRVSSFFWQPWFAQIGGGVSASVGYGIYDNGKSPWRMHRVANLLNRTVSGKADLKLLPRSRFPFNVDFERTDYRYEFGSNKPQGDLMSVADHFEVRQSYSTRRSAIRFDSAYITNETNIGGVPTYRSKIINLDVAANPFEKQVFLINANRSRIEKKAGESRWISKLVTRHSYLPDTNMSIRTLASKVKTENDWRNSGNSYVNEILQFNSFGTMRPTNSRLTVVGGVYLNDHETSINGGNAFGDSVTGANLGANLALNKWFRLYLTGSVTDRNGIQNVSSTSLSSLNISLAFRHNANKIKLGEIDYNKSAAATIYNSATNVSAIQQSGSVSSSGTTQGASVVLSQGLDRHAAFGNENTNWSYRQWVTSSSSRSSSRIHSSPPTLLLNQSAALAWSRKGSMIRLSGATTRNMRGTRHYFESVNLQSTQTENVNSNSSLSGNLTINASRQGYEENPLPPEESLTSSASIDYVNNRAFGIRNLRATSRLKIFSPELLKSSRQELYQSKSQWNNKLKYEIGKLSLELQATLEDIQSHKQFLLTFQANRQF